MIVLHISRRDQEIQQSLTEGKCEQGPSINSRDKYNRGIPKSGDKWKTNEWLDPPSTTVSQVRYWSNEIAKQRPLQGLVSVHICILICCRPFPQKPPELTRMVALVDISMTEKGFV
jgi:hypothetical protein